MMMVMMMLSFVSPQVNDNANDFDEIFTLRIAARVHDVLFVQGYPCIQKGPVVNTGEW